MRLDWASLTTEKAKVVKETNNPQENSHLTSTDQLKGPQNRQQEKHLQVLLQQLLVLLT